MITIGVPRWLFGLTSMLLFLGLGGAAGAAAFRYGPYARLEAQLNSAREVVKSKDQRLSETRRQLDALLADHRRVKEQLRQKDLDLTAARIRLRQTERERQAAAEEVARQRGIVLSKERDIYVLRTCLVGVAAFTSNYLDGDYDAAVYAIRSVERECEAARDLVD